MKTIRPQYVYLTEVCDGTVRPAVVVKSFGNHSVLIPLRAVYDDEVKNGITLDGDVYVQFEGNLHDGSVAQVGSIKSVPNKKIGRELGRLYDVDAKSVLDMLLVTE